MLRLFCRIVGSILALLGLITFLTPLPGGFLLFLVGLAILIPASPATARFIRWLRIKVRPFDRTMTIMTNKLPNAFKLMLKETEIDQLN